VTDTTGHDHGHPLSYLSAMEMLTYAARHMRCQHCRMTIRLLPMHGTAWAIDFDHEDGCPEREDDW
jgi:hypothetical protein